MTLSQFPDYKDIIASARVQFPEINILQGIEADYYSGCETFLEPWLRENSFDLVIGSVHYIDSWGFDNPKEIETWDSVDITETWAAYFRLISKMAGSGLYDIVGHLDLPKIFKFIPPSEELSRIAAPALDSIAESGMTIEINTSGLRKPIKEIYPSPLLLKMAREREIPICFGSDSHEPSTVGEDFSKALDLAKGAGYSERARFSDREMTLVALP